MKYTLAFAAAFTGALAATSKSIPGYGETPSSAATTAAPATTPAPAGPETSTVFQTEVDTIFSCGPEVTSCPYRSTSETPKTTSVAPPPPPPTTSVEIKTTAPATSTKVSTEVIKSTETAKSTVVISSTTPAASSTQPPKTTQPPVVSSVAPPPPPPVTLVSTSIQIEQCTPSTITHYITVVSQPVESKMTPVVQTTPLATSKPFSAPYGTAPSYSAPSGSVAMKPTPSVVSPPIQTGAAAANSIQLSGVAVAFAAYLLF